MFWFGDLNFRIESLDICFVKYAIDSNVLSQLWEKDQVRDGHAVSLHWILSSDRLTPKLPMQDKACPLATPMTRRALGLMSLGRKG